MIDRFERRWRRLRRRTSRGSIGARLLRLPRAPEEGLKPGLVLVQIDGLAHGQISEAIEKGRMPFLAHLLQKERYRLHHHYSGVPSTTPSVQGELFYGVRQAVPAFSFLNARLGKVVRMFDADAAAEVQSRIEKMGEGLLRDGSVYSDIYDGGAGESHFCPATWGWKWVRRVLSPLVLAPFLVSHFGALVRLAALLALECVIAVVDMFRGLIARQDFVKEFKYIPMRVGICILLREILVIGSTIDIARGLPVIHVNFLGYDEQAHRRGPSSRFAHWSLKGIDDAIEKIWKAAQGSGARQYDVWVYSDHGQSETIPYPVENGRTVQEAIAAIFDPGQPAPKLSMAERSGIQEERGKWIGLPRQDPDPAPAPSAPPPPAGALTVTAMGPIGYIYLPGRLGASELDRDARRLVEEANIPLVGAPDPDGGAWAWNRSGRFHLPEQAAEILGPDHPFLADAGPELADLCRHPDAGDFMISGWRLGKTPVSFPLENGSHAGPGPEETDGFALLPVVAPLRERDHPYLRPLDLRHAALRKLGRDGADANPFYIQPSRSDASGRTLRVLTYNVHSCVGMDGQVSVARIARVIMETNADVVALQELDVGRERTGGEDQAHEIARHLEMDFHFHPAIRIEEELYGDAILSRLPMRLVKSAMLPTLPDKPRLEPRGALWAEIDAGAGPLHFINTHLGLLGRERLRQAQALLGPEWLGHADRIGATLLCGDLNAHPGMGAYRRFAAVLRDAQREAANHRPKGTWFGRYPLGRIDHVFINEHVEAVAVEVQRSQLARIASDHLPLIVTIRIKDS